MSERSEQSSMASPDENWLQRRFKLYQRGTQVKTECLAGITGFLAAAYLLVVIPGLLAAGGMDKGAATTGVILVFVLGSLLMAFYANLPFMVGPGIGGSVLGDYSGGRRRDVAGSVGNRLLVGDRVFCHDRLRPA